MIHTTKSSCYCPNCDVKVHESFHNCEKNCEQHGPFPTAWTFFRTKDEWNFKLHRQEIVISFMRLCRPYSYETKEIRLVANIPTATVKFLKEKLK